MGRRAATLALFLASLTVALLVFEGVSRWAGVDLNPNPFWSFDPLLGWRQERSRVFDLQIEGEPVRIEFNALGFRDVEHQVPKPPGTRRVVVVGDSFSEAVQVNLEETYWHRFAALMSETSGAPWEVINLGVGDYGNAQAYLALTEIGLRYEPDLVIVQIFPLNDVCNNSILLEGLCRSQNDTYRPYFVPAANGLELARADPIRHWLRSRSVAFGLLERTYRGFTEAPGVEAGVHVERFTRLGIPADPLLFTFAAPAHQIEGIAFGWHVTERILAQIDAVCRRASARWIPVVVPFHARMDGSWDSFSSGFAAPLVRRYPEERLGALFDELGVPSVLLLDAFDRNSDAVLPPIDGHLNRTAHDLVAREIQAVATRLDWTAPAP